MQKILGFILMVVGVGLGLYVGFWVCLVGGIVDVISEIRSDNLIVINLAISIAKVVCSGFIGQLAALIFVIPGYSMFNKIF